MIKLDELDIWQKLSGPYANSIEIPSLISKLSNTHNKKTADILIWEYIYHQGSTYENTLATIPHLIQLIYNSNDINFKFDLILSLGIVLIGFDLKSDLNTIFKKNNLNNEIKNRIKIEFINSLKKFKNIVNNSLCFSNNLDETSKRFLLVAYLVSISKHKEANVFKTFNQNDEYMFVCPKCNEETFLWNEDNVLNAYAKDPVSNKNQSKIIINSVDSENNIEWLNIIVNKIQIESLEPLLSYFNGNINCYNCNKKTNVFKGILNSL